MGRLDDAIAAYRRAVADAESTRVLGSPVPYLVLGSALREKGSLAEARKYLDLAARFEPTRPEALRELGSLPR
jgi:tetratricopeptide (TPR) repeat protein